MMKSITGASPKDCYAFADEMLTVRKQKSEVKDEDEIDVGIARVAPKRVYRRRG